MGREKGFGGKTHFSKGANTGDTQKGSVLIGK